MNSHTHEIHHHTLENSRPAFAHDAHTHTSGTHTRVVSFHHSETTSSSDESQGKTVCKHEHLHGEHSRVYEHAGKRHTNRPKYPSAGPNAFSVVGPSKKTLVITFFVIMFMRVQTVRVYVCANSVLVCVRELV